MKEIEVVAAIIVKSNKILCMQRRESSLEYISKKFEFPGGKVESSELKHIALMRELKEEMDISLIITEDDYYMSIDHTYPDFRMIMHSYIAYIEEVEFVMNDHISYQWLSKDKLMSLDWAPADIPIVKMLAQEV